MTREEIEALQEPYLKQATELPTTGPRQWLRLIVIIAKLIKFGIQLAIVIHAVWSIARRFSKIKKELTLAEAIDVLDALSDGDLKAAVDLYTSGALDGEGSNSDSSRKDNLNDGGNGDRSQPDNDQDGIDGATARGNSKYSPEEVRTARLLGLTVEELRLTRNYFRKQ